MKKTITMAGIIAGLSLGSVQAQVSTVNFEDVQLDASGYYNGVDLKGGFTSNNVFFSTLYDTTYQYWYSGFAPSKIVDDTTSGFSNLYGAYPKQGFANSSTYAIAQNFSGFAIPSALMLKSMYLSNSTFAGLSMKNGDDFAKKFGGTDGNDKDFFTLSIIGYSNGIALTDTVLFYLADFRFDDNTQDYILKDWAKVDVSVIGSADSVAFVLNSSDIGQFGMNTPAFFAIDQIEFESTSSVSNTMSNFSVYPNPAQDVLYSATFNNAQVQVYSVQGNLLVDFYSTAEQFDIQSLDKGMYVLLVHKDGKILRNRFIKN